MTEEHLFMGGPMDGQRIEIPMRQTTFDGVATPRPELLDEFMPLNNAKPCAAEFKTVRYFRQVVNVPNTPHRYLLMTLTGNLEPEHIMQVLIRGYRRVED